MQRKLRSAGKTRPAHKAAAGFFYWAASVGGLVSLERPHDHAVADLLWHLIAGSCLNSEASVRF
jgi:hypothetical protein